MLARRPFLFWIIAALCMVVARGASAGEFKLTVNSYDESSNINAAIQNELGADWRLADWSDILKVWNTDRDAFPTLMATIGGSTRFVSYYGDRFWSGDRHYIVAVHNHQVPSGWLVHAHIDNHLVDLGSWYDPHRALAYRDTVVPEPTGILVVLMGACGIGGALGRRRRAAR